MIVEVPKGNNKEMKAYIILKTIIDNFSESM